MNLDFFVLQLVPHNDEAFQVFLDEINQLGQNDIHTGSQNSYW